MIVNADCLRLPLADKSVDLSFGSPPYADARTYGIGAQRDCLEWVEWMLGVVTELARVTRGPVIINAAGVTRDRNYWPACEGLMWEWWKRAGSCHLYRPCFYHRVGIPGSGGDDWFRSDTEFVMCFKPSGRLPWSDNTAMGNAPKWGPGGEMSYRMADGARVNQWGKPVRVDGNPSGCDGDIEPGKPSAVTKKPSHKVYKIGDNRRANGVYKKMHSKSLADGTNEIQEYEPPAIANPGNRIEETYTATEVDKLLAVHGDMETILVGGGMLGSKLAHENEAPMPEKLAEWFVLSCCPPGGLVLDPWSGSGTTAAVCKREGRRYMAIDLRFSQCELTRRRLNTVTPSLFAG